MAVNQGMRFLRSGKARDPEFLADSAEQVAQTIDKPGLHDKISQAFAAAITRARGCPQRSFGPAINEAREVDSGNDASLK